MRSFDEFIGMDKEAAARWKKEFGNLSEGAKDTLKKNVAKSSEDMVRGLERGNSALIEKMQKSGDLNKVVSHRNTPAIYKHIRGGIGKEINPIYSYIGAKVSQINRAGTSSGTTEGKNNLVLGFKADSKDKDRYKLTSSKIKRMFYTKDAELGKMSKGDKRAVDALILRHELDEARSLAKNGIHVGNYSSHNAPDVIHRESANLALMPEKVKRAFTGLRKENSMTKNKLVKKIIGGDVVRGGEVESLAKRGIKYGDSPYLDKKKMKSHVNDYLKGKEVLEPTRIK